LKVGECTVGQQQKVEIIKALYRGARILILDEPTAVLIPQEIDELYSMIGTTLKHNFAGTTAWLITSNRESLKHVGLKPKEKHILFNGALECILLKYEMYKGTKKMTGAATSP
jgi:putative N6-adenine-specific DNA methylase